MSYRYSTDSFDGQRPVLDFLVPCSKLLSLLTSTLMAQILLDASGILHMLNLGT